MLNTSIDSKCFHITIGTHPSKGINLEQDVRLIKAGLLYADKIKLYSLTASMIQMFLRMRDIYPNQQLMFIQKVIPYMTSRKEAKNILEFLKRYRKNLRNKHPTKNELIIRTQLKTLLEEQWCNLIKIINDKTKNAGNDSVTSALQSGLLELHIFDGTNNDEMILDFMTDCVALASQSHLISQRKSDMSKRDGNMIREFVDEVSSTVSNGFTYPLFDDPTRELIKTNIEEKKISVSESSILRGKHSGLARHLLNRLPLFEQASVDEILDIRRELDKPLIRFRSAMMRFSEEIKSAYWDDDFTSDAENVFYRDVKPAILEIEELVKTNKYITSLLRKSIDKPLILPSGSAFAMIMSQMSSLPAEYAYSLGIGSSLAAIVYDAYKEWKQKRQSIEQNQIFFYYQVQNKLSK